MILKLPLVSRSNIEKKFTDDKNAKDKEINNKFKDLESMIKNQTKKKVDQLNCTECDFTTTSGQGLKTHVNSKYKKLNKEKYPKLCELCEMEVNDEKEMKLHITI